MGAVKLTTTIDQHQGTHPNGLRVFRLLTIETEHALPDRPTLEERAEVEDFVARLHSARVDLASLDADHRQAAEDWLDVRDVDAADEAQMIRAAIQATVCDV